MEVQGRGDLPCLLLVSKQISVRTQARHAHLVVLGSDGFGI